MKLNFLSPLLLPAFIPFFNILFVLEEEEDEEVVVMEEKDWL